MCVGGREKEKSPHEKSRRNCPQKKCCGNRAVACALCVRPRSDLRVRRPLRGAHRAPVLANTAFGRMQPTLLPLARRCTLAA